MRRKTVVRVASIILSAGMLLQPISAMAEGNVKAPISTEVAQDDTYGAADKLKYSSDGLKEAVDAAERQTRQHMSHSRTQKMHRMRQRRLLRQLKSSKRESAELLKS